jgi:hypothetical protein
LDTLHRLSRRAISSLPRPRVRLGMMLILVALLAVILAFLTNEWRREEREAEARHLESVAEGRKRRANEFRRRQRDHLDRVEQLRQRLVRTPSHGVNYRPSRWDFPSKESIQPELDWTLAMAVWAGGIAELLDWAADHPAEPLRPEPPMPLPRNADLPRLGPTPATPPVKPPVDPGNIGRYAVPRVVKNPK